MFAILYSKIIILKNKKYAACYNCNFFFLIQSVNKCYSKKASDASGLKVTFTGEEMSLDIPESGVSLESGWNIKRLSFKVAMCRVIYIYI